MKWRSRISKRIRCSRRKKINGSKRKNQRKIIRINREEGGAGDI
jgi:hypothetical protein